MMCFTGLSTSKEGFSLRLKNPYFVPERLLRLHRRKAKKILQCFLIDFDNHRVNVVF